MNLLNIIFMFFIVAGLNSMDGSIKWKLKNDKDITVYNKEEMTNLSIFV